MAMEWWVSKIFRFLRVLAPEAITHALQRVTLVV